MAEPIHTSVRIIVSLLGVITSLITGIILGLIEAYTGYALYSWMFWFVIPVGAILAGFCAATGHYFGATYFHQKPLGGPFLNIIIASLGAFVLVHYIPYYLMDINGIRVKDALPFWQYLDLYIRNTSLSLVRGNLSTGTLGGFWGYIYACLQLLGFSLGGIAVFFWLANNPFCKKCSRYLTISSQRDRYSSDGQSLIDKMRHFQSLLNSQEFEKAIRFHEDEMGIDISPGHHLRARLITRVCSGCGINHLDFFVSKLGKDNWEDVNGSQIRIFTYHNLRTPDVLK